AELGHVRAVQTGAPDVLGGIEERLQHADGFQDLEGTGLDRRGPRLAVRPRVPLDEPRLYSVAGELGGGEQARRASADDQDVVARPSEHSGRKRCWAFPYQPAVVASTRPALICRGTELPPTPSPGRFDSPASAIGGRDPAPRPPGPAPSP